MSTLVISAQNAMAAEALEFQACEEYQRVSAEYDSGLANRNQLAKAWQVWRTRKTQAYFARRTADRLRGLAS